MNKQHLKNYFRGYNNKFRDKVYKSKDDHNFYITNLISVVKLYTIDSDYIDGDESNIKKFVDMFDSWEYYGYIDQDGHIYDKSHKPNYDFGFNPKIYEKIALLVHCNDTTEVLKNKDSNQIVLKIIGDYGYGYMLPIRNY